MSCSRMLQCFVLVAGALSSVPPLAQDFPNKPVRLVVPNSAGTTADLVARVIGQEMSKLLGQPMVVENKPGADSIIGYEYVAKQVPADGYHIAVALVTSLATLPILAKDLRFDPLRDLPPVIGIAESRIYIGSSKTLPWSTFSGMISHIRANPGKMNYGSSSSNVRLWTESIVRSLDLQGVHIGYSGGAQYLTGMATGEIYMGFLTEASLNTLIDRVHILAVTGAQRNPKFPAVPTFREVGQPQISGIQYSFNVRAGTPQPVIDKLYATAAATLKLPEVVDRFSKMQFEIIAEAPGPAAKRLADEARSYAEVARKAKM